MAIREQVKLAGLKLMSSLKYQPDNGKRGIVALGGLISALLKLMLVTKRNRQ